MWSEVILLVIDCSAAGTQRLLLGKSAGEGAGTRKTPDSPTLGTRAPWELMRCGWPTIPWQGADPFATVELGIGLEMLGILDGGGDRGLWL